MSITLLPSSASSPLTRRVLPLHSISSTMQRDSGKDSVEFLCGGWDGFQKVAFCQMCPVEDDEVFVLLDFEQSVRIVRMDLDR